jgi:drug/metabolite transporter (DMT)-like permease
MITGYAYAVVAMVSLGCLGLLSKLAERRGCSPLATTTAVFAAATIMMALQVAVLRGAGFTPGRQVVLIALAFGTVSVLASWLFLYGIRFGKITTSWVLINLSAAVPTVASTLLYREPMGWRKLAALLLAAVAILLLWKDMEAETKSTERPAESTAGANASSRN